MNEPASLPMVPVAVQTVDPDTVFSALGDPTRRQVLLALFDGQARTATVLKGIVGRRLDATLKHLVELRKAGLIVSNQDKTDGRRQAYSLAPSVKVAETPEGRTMDFGYCVVRL